MPRLVNRQSIAAVIQPSSAFLQPTSAQSIETLDFSFSWANNEISEQPTIRNFSMNESLQPCNNSRLVELNFKTYLKGSAGAIDVPPPTGQLLRAAGYTETIAAGVSTTYTLSNNPIEVLSIVFYQEQFLVEIKDCIVSNLKTTLTANGLPIEEWTLIGRINSFGEGAVAFSPIFTLGKPSPMNGISLVMGAQNVNSPSEFSFELANETSAGEMAINSSDGFVEPNITSRKCTGTFNPLFENGAVGLAWNLFWESNSTILLSLGMIGTTVGNRVQLSFGRTSFTSVEHSTRGKLLSYDIGLRFNENVGSPNTEFSRVYT